MDMMLFGNMLLMFGAFALQFGLMGDNSTESASNETPEATEPDVTIPIVALYDPALYGSEETGTTGEDAFDFAGSPAGVAVFLNSGNDLLDGSFQNDYAEGGEGDDTMSLRPGDDIAFGDAGDDSIDGGLGDDTLFGGDGNDWLSGSKDNDEVHGDAGDDTLIGSRGNDSLDGGSGNDVLYGNTEGNPGLTDDGADTLSGGDGNDDLHLAGGDEGSGGAGSDSFLLYDPGDSGTVAEVNDFNASEDMIGVFYTPEIDPDTGDTVMPDVSVVPDDSGTQGIVSLDGVEIARITGGQALTANDIAMIAEDV